MSNPPTRNLLKIVLENFVKSFRPRQIRGNLVGEDYFGNKYYEIPPNPAIGKRKASRWFEPADKEAFDNELTAEWEAWLRGRRDDPPTRDELVLNLSIQEMKKKNAEKLDQIYGKKADETVLPKDTKGSESFPKYDEYEIIPGKDKKY